MITEELDNFGIPLSESSDEFKAIESAVDQMKKIYHKNVFPKLPILMKYENEKVKKIVSLFDDLEANLLSLNDLIFEVSTQRE